MDRGGMTMFGFVTANVRELEKEQRLRYNAVYCGICRQIRERSSQMCRLGLSYDMAFLALFLMSLYEPKEVSGDRACGLHPIKPKKWVDSEYIQYAADMNVALAYYKAMDDWQDDQKQTAKLMMEVFGKTMPRIRQQYSRQCQAIEESVRRIADMEKLGCKEPDLPAEAFGLMMSELLVYDYDMWTPILRNMGMALGRFIYLADAAVDYRRDKRKKKYNPFLAMGMEEDWEAWDNLLVMTMDKCTEEYEKLPLVQDKSILDNILYSGVWCNIRGRKKEVKRDDR